MTVICTFPSSIPVVWRHEFPIADGVLETGRGERVERAVEMSERVAMAERLPRPEAPKRFGSKAGSGGAPLERDNCRSNHGVYTVEVEMVGVIRVTGTRNTWSRTIRRPRAASFA